MSCCRTVGWRKSAGTAASRLRLLDRIPEIPPHRAVCVARHERRLSTGRTQAELADHEIGLVRFQYLLMKRARAEPKDTTTKTCFQEREREQEER